MGPQDGSIGHLRAVLAEVASRLAVLAGGNPEPVLSPLPLDGFEGSRLADLVASMALDPVEAGLLVVGVGAEVDVRFGDLFASLDVSGGARRRPRVATALHVAGSGTYDAAALEALDPRRTLRRSGLLSLGDTDRPLIEQVLVVPPRVVTHLLGGDQPDPAVVASRVPHVVADLPAVGPLAEALLAGTWAVWVKELVREGRSVAAGALAAIGATPIVADLGPSPVGDRPGIALALVREACLVGGGVVVHGVHPTDDRALVEQLLQDPPCPTLVVSDRRWEPHPTVPTPLLLEVAPMAPEARVELWRGLLGAIEVDASADELAAHRLGPEQTVDAVTAAVRQSTLLGGVVTVEALRQGARAQATDRLGELADRIEPRATFDDLVLEPDVLEELRALPGRFRSHHVVRDQWGMGGRSSRQGRGITCLFAGPSGTGKTLAAEVVAGSLGADLFVVDLSQVIDKYIGETEKNLDRIFLEAENVHGVLLFDEADALFGKRSEVSDAHDRHANVEVAYLLQRMESFAGIAVLTTNFSGNLDEAFLRRLDVVCAFSAPGPEERRVLWERHLPPAAPTADDVDLDALATAFNVTGGSIRNSCLAAAYRAAAADRAITMADLVLACGRELRKLRRLVDPAGLGDWASVLDG